MAFLDEPTSGLDGTAAFDVIKTIKGFADSSKGTFSVMLSIHQPNLRILNLFNHILLLGGGGSVFFGSMPEAVTHFSAIGHPPPPGQVPTDFFMQVADSSFSLTNTQGTNFVQKFTTSSTNMATVKAVDDSVVVSTFALLLEGQEEKPSGTTFWRQFTTLTKRDALLATRDPTLYYLQFVLHVVYGFLIGATFHHVPTVLDDRASLPAASCLWILMLQSYIHVFKVFYLVASNKRFEHERANGSYGVMAYFLSELFVTAMAQLIWIPGVTVAFFLVGFPSSVYPFAILAAYSMALAAESMLNLITKFNHDASKAVVLSQAALVILTVFGGGMFRPYDEFPSYWNWLKELAIFTQGSKAMMLAVFEELTFLCPAESVTADSMCMGISNVYACTTDPVTEECQVDGLTVLDTEAGGLSGNKWEFLGYLALLFLVFRLSILFLYWYPWDMLALNLKNWAAPYTVAITLQHEMEIRRLWGQVRSLRKNIQLFDCPAAQHEEWEISGVNQSLLQKGSNFVGMEKVRHISPTHQTELVFQDVTVRLPKGGKVLIDSVSGMARSGHVLALMGPSGAGKTTLLNALSGRAVYASVEGSVALGAVGAEAKRALTPGELDYVPQFDDLNEHFTPRELLTYMNRLKQQNKPARDSKCQVIELLYILGLVQKADQAVKTLSGGEKKRLSIAMGMVAAPRVLFLDEPTTGLDSAAAYSVVGYISKVARETNVVCIMTIHQPAGEVFNQLEDLMLLEEGHQAYFGGITRARDFFTSVAGPCPPQSNPADVYLDLISEPPVLNGGGRPTTWKELYRSSEFFVPVPEAKPSPASSRAGADGSEDGSPGKLSRLITVTRQMVEYYWRNTAVHWLRLGELAVLALYTGTMFLRLDSSQISEFSAAVFFNVWCVQLVLFAVIAAVPTFVKDRRIALQEMLNGAYSPSTYCLGQFIASIPFTLLSAIIFQSIFHWLVGLNDSFEPFIYTIFLTAGLLLMMEAIMLLVVETLKNAMLACTFSMVVLGMLFLFAGFFVKVSDITDSISWLAWAIPSKYAFEGYLYMVFHGQEYDTSYGTVSGDAILKGQFAQGPDVNAWGDFGVILAYVLLFRLAHYGIINTGLKPYRNAMSRF
ncbi:unnamed protein product [Discosporangium mesarthrocarpum]